MRNYNDRMEAAYLFSKRQGDLMRDRDRESSAHEDRRNRYLDERDQGGVMRYGGSGAARRTMDSYRPVANDYREVLEDHRGTGPKNYRRSDERIKELVCDSLCDNPDIDASGIDVEVKDSEVILSGNVSARYAKRLAEDLAEQVTGVSNVENRLRVLSGEVSQLH